MIGHGSCTKDGGTCYAHNGRFWVPTVGAWKPVSTARICFLSSLVRSSSFACHWVFAGVRRPPFWLLRLACVGVPGSTEGELCALPSPLRIGGGCRRDPAGTSKRSSAVVKPNERSVGQAGSKKETDRHMPLYGAAVCCFAQQHV